ILICRYTTYMDTCGLPFELVHTPFGSFHVCLFVVDPYGANFYTIVFYGLWFFCGGLDGAVFSFLAILGYGRFVFEYIYSFDSVWVEHFEVVPCRDLSVYNIKDQFGFFLALLVHFQGICPDHAVFTLSGGMETCKGLVVFYEKYVIYFIIA